MFTNLLQEEKIQVLATEREVLIRSGFSRENDLVLRLFNTANEGAFLISRDLPLDAGVDYFYPNLHFGNDDYPAMGVENYGYISGNHGSIAAHFIEAEDHPFTEKNTGLVLTNEKEEEFVLVSVPGKDHFIIHGVGKGNSAVPLFPVWEDGRTKLFFNGKELPFTKRRFMQLYPCNRITKYEFLIDGKTPLEKSKITECSFLEFHFDHDVVSPLHLAAFMKENAGREMLLPPFQRHMKMCFAHTKELQEKYAHYMQIPALFTQKNLFTFQPCGCYTNKRNIHFHLPLAKVDALDVMQIWNEALSEMEKEEFYIPKLKDLTLRYSDGAPDSFWKSNSVFTCPKKMDTVRLLEKEKDALDPADPPDRFIKLASSAAGREVGFSLGYSLLHGFTAKENRGKDRKYIYSINPTKKLYPRSYTLQDVEPGKSMEVMTYKHYFDPQREEDATSFYFHREGDSLVLYLDFHKPLSGKEIKLPSSMADKKISIVEKTENITLHTEKKIPQEPKLLLDLAGDFGYLVLKLD